MKTRTAFGACLIMAFALLCIPVGAAETSPSPVRDPIVERQLGALNSALDELHATAPDHSPEQRTHRGARLNEAFVALTGEAVNPLFGVTTLGIYNYFRTPEYLRESLPLYDQPVIWVPLLCILLLMLFNSTICEAMPFLKVPLNAVGDIVNKAGAIAVLPLVIKMFADAVAQPAAEHFAYAANVAFPVAYAGESALSTAWFSLGWLAGAIVGLAVYLAVWLTFNVVDVLILICPFPGVDALLKSLRLGVIGLLAGVNQVSPGIAMILAVVIVLISFLLAGWSFRLSVFGLVFSTDILFFRKRGVKEGDVNAFSCTGLVPRGVPMRTWGRLERDGDNLLFSYRPWLVLSRRSVVLGDAAAAFSCGSGLVNPFLVADDEPNLPWLRLPPRYRGQEQALADRFGLRRVVGCGVSGALRTWVSEIFGSGKPAAREAAA